MSRDKQIEEMDAIIRGAVNGCSSYWSGLIANALLDEGYRKASEVAREIFEEIQSYCIGRRWKDRDIVSFEIDAVKYAELKKKYESEGAADGSK